MYGFGIIFITNLPLLANSIDLTAVAVEAPLYILNDFSNCIMHMEMKTNRFLTDIGG